MTYFTLLKKILQRFESLFRFLEEKFLFVKVWEGWIKVEKLPISAWACQIERLSVIGF